MKLLLFIAPLISFFSSAQDTIYDVTHQSGIRQLMLVEHDDTIYKALYPSGSVESIRQYTMLDTIFYYERFHENGKIMLRSHLYKFDLHDTCTYFDPKGNLVAKFIYKQGEITDTLYNSSKHSFILGKATYYSVVHGGMQREDGSSNISGGHGIYIFNNFYAVRLIKGEHQSKYKSFTTDFNGNFFILVPEGEYGIFPEAYKIENVKEGMASPSVGHSMSSFASWNLKEPIKITKNSFYLLNLHFRSEGYAP